MGVYPAVSPPDWDNLIGGESESGWIAARDRKVMIAASSGAAILRTGRDLDARGSAFECSPGVLKEVPDATRWFVSLAGLPEKTLGNVRKRLKDFGVGITPSTIARRLGAGKQVKEEELIAFSNWINSELNSLYPLNGRHFDLALSVVLVIAGGRIQGQVQNMAGDDAVLLLKRLLIDWMEKRGIEAEVSEDGLNWQDYRPEVDLNRQSRVAFGDRLVCEFVPGGNRPDIRVLLNGVEVLVGEVKGRKDLSNVWESWMPQINGHLRTWAQDNPDAPRVFLGTIITAEMIDGTTPSGTQHAGLRTMYKTGLLNSVFNLSLIATGQRAAAQAFDGLVDTLAGMAKR